MSLKCRWWEGLSRAISESWRNTEKFYMRYELQFWIPQTPWWFWETCLVCPWILHQNGSLPHVFLRGCTSDWSPTVTFFTVVITVTDFNVFVSVIICQHFFFLFGHKTSQEVDCFSTKWDNSKDPSLVAHFQLEDYGSPTPQRKCQGKHFECGKVPGKQTLSPQTDRTGLMSSHQVSMLLLAWSWYQLCFGGYQGWMVNQNHSPWHRPAEVFLCCPTHPEYEQLAINLLHEPGKGLNKLNNVF